MKIRNHVSKVCLFSLGNSPTYEKFSFEFSAQLHFGGKVCLTLAICTASLLISELVHWTLSIQESEAL